MADNHIRRHADGNGRSRLSTWSWMNYFTGPGRVCVLVIVCMLFVYLYPQLSPYVGALTTGITKWLGEQVNLLKSPAAILLAITIIVPCIVFGVGMSSDIFFNRRSVAVIVVFSFVWNWIYFYQEENNHALNLQIPANCMPHKMTWVQALQEWFSSMTSIRTDECFEYYRIPLIRALSRTVNLFFVDTFRYIGQAIYECHAEFFRDQETFVAVSALIACYGSIAVYVLISYITAEKTTSTGSYPVTGFPNDI